MSFQEAMELMLKTTTIDDMELVVISAPGHRRVLKAMELVVTTTTTEDMELVVIIAPGRKAGAEVYGAGGNNTNYGG